MDDGRLQMTLQSSPFSSIELELFDFDQAEDRVEQRLTGQKVPDALLIDWDPLRVSEIRSICHAFRASGILIAVLGLATPSERVAAISVGADCEHPCPPSLILLRAQIGAHRRIIAESSNTCSTGRPRWATRACFTVGPLAISWNEREARIRDCVLDLKPRQFELLALFSARHRHVLSRERILRDVWDCEFDTGTNVVDVYVHHLRRALGQAGLKSPIKTVRGRGYRLVMDEATWTPPAV